MMKAIVAALLSLVLLAPAAHAQAQVKIGLIATLSGGGAPQGQDLLDGFNLGVKHTLGRLGGLPTEIIVGDDQQRPETGRELALRMVERDRVDVVTGIVSSPVLLALAKPVLDAGVILISGSAGPADLAGRSCRSTFFSVSGEDGNAQEAMARHLSDQSVKSAYLLAPDTTAGKDALLGFKRFFRGNVVGETYTRPGEADFGAVLSQVRSAAPGAVFASYSGGSAINFVKQYAQSGLKGSVPLYGPGILLDQTTVPTQDEAATGLFNTSFWSPDLKNPKNQRFVSDFRATFGRIPSGYAAQGYDAAQLIDSAIRAVGGNLGDRVGFSKALEDAAFTSVRGPFKFNRNHFPIQNFYLREVVREASGTPVNRLVSIVFEGHADAYSKTCRM